MVQIQSPRPLTLHMNYTEIAPPALLTRHIECFWTLSSGGQTAPASAHRILPDGCCELVLNLADRFRQLWDDGSSKLQSHMLLAGQMVRPLRVLPTGRVEIIGVRFRPAGTFAFLGLPAKELTGAIVSLDSVSARLHRLILDRVMGRVSFTSQLTALETILSSQLGAGQPVRQNVEAAVRVMEKTSGNVSVSALQRMVGVGSRTLEREFDRAVGLPPKMLCRILRFQTVFQAIERHDVRGWAAVAAECGCTDQAHLIRDFREFAGETSVCLLANDDLLLHYFLRKNRVSHLYNTHNFRAPNLPQ